MKNLNKTIYFDMDGTIANLYGVEGWLNDLDNENVRPYRDAKPLINMNTFAKVLHRLQAQGYTIGIISWLSKFGTDDYNARVTETKKRWLRKHLASVKFDEVYIVKYGTPKATVTNPNNVNFLFDDEKRNRDEWCGIAYNVDNIINTLKAM